MKVVTLYQAFDGELFEKREECASHEAKYYDHAEFERQTIKQKDLYSNIGNYCCNLMFVENEEQRKYVWGYHANPSDEYAFPYDLDEIQLGKWNAFISKSEYDGDWYLCDVNDIKEDLENMLKIVNNISSEEKK